MKVRTDHLALVLHEAGEVLEDVVHLNHLALDRSDLRVTLRNERVLELALVLLRLESPIPCCSKKSAR